MRFPTVRSHPLQAALFLFAAVAAGGLRQAAPHGIAWFGRWPTSATSAEQAYAMLAKPGDPPFIDLQEVIRLHETGHAGTAGAVTLIDARSTDEYSQGHLPGARSLPFYEMEAHQQKALQGLTADSPLILYCEGVGCELSFFLGRELQGSGYKNIRIFYGGFPEWKDAGLPLEK